MTPLRVLTITVVACNCLVSTEQIKPLKDLEKENARPKRLLAKRCLEVDAMKDVLAPTVRRAVKAGSSFSSESARLINSPQLRLCSIGRSNYNRQPRIRRSG